MQAAKGFAMEKWMCWGSLVVGGLLLLLFILDLILSIAQVPFTPFGGISPVVDVVGGLASGLLAYLAWDALRDVK
jgi:hypothetical protein